MIFMEKERIEETMMEKTQVKKLQEKTAWEVLWVLKSVTVTPIWWVGDGEHTLTGSGTLIKITRAGSKPKRILIDFGIHQWKNHYELNQEILFNPSKIDFVILTHAHMDHIGRIPMLVNGKKVFKWKIYSTNITQVLTVQMLIDSANVMEKTAKSIVDMAITKEAKLKNHIKELKDLEQLLNPSKKDKKNKWYRKNNTRLQKIRTRYNSDAEMRKRLIKIQRELRLEGIKNIWDLERKFRQIKNTAKERVLYTKEDISLLTKKKPKTEENYFIWSDFYKSQTIVEGIKLSFIKAAHILGSAQIILEIDDGKWWTYNMGFSGDLWRYDEYNNLGKPDFKIDELLEREKWSFSFDSYQIESTYGWKLDHPNREEELKRMKWIIKQIIEQNGKILIPAFTLQRSQDLYGISLELKKELQKEFATKWKSFPNFPIYYDGITIDKVNDIYRTHDIEWGFYSNIFNPKNSITKSEYEKNWPFLENDESSIMIVPSGMLAGWKVLSYLEHICQNKNNAIFFVWYQAEWTLWYLISKNIQDSISLEQKNIRLLSQIHIFESFSSHGDETDLLTHLENLPFKKNASLFLNHGDINDSQKKLEKAIRDYGVIEENVSIMQPRVGETVKLF